MCFLLLLLPSVSVIPQPVYMNAEELQRMAAISNSAAAAASSSSGGANNNNNNNNNGGSPPSVASSSNANISSVILGGGAAPESPDDDLKTPTVEELSFPGAKAVSYFLSAQILMLKLNVLHFLLLFPPRTL